MMKFEYSVIKYTPDPRRGEIVNIGLVIFGNTPAGQMDVRMLHSAAKIRMLDGLTATESIDSLKSAIEEISQFGKNPEEIHNIFNSFGKSSGYLGNIGYFVIDDENQYEKRVSNLFNELVRPFATRENSPRTSRIHTIIKNKFQSLELLGKDSDDLSRHKVVYNYLISNKTGVTADFLLKNGRYHITEAIDFNVNDISAKFKETSLKVMAFMEGRKSLGQETASYFVYNVSKEKEDRFLSHLNLVDGYSDRMFNLSSKTEKDDYFSLMSNLAGREVLRLH